MSQSVADNKEIVLVDLLDRILYKGVILRGDITISVANVDLIYLGLKLLLTSVDKVDELRRQAVWGAQPQPGSRVSVETESR